MNTTALKKISNAAYRAAYYDSENRKTLNRVARRYRARFFDPHEKDEWRQDSILEALWAYDSTKGTVFTSFLWTVAQRKLLRLMQRRKRAVREEPLTDRLILEASEAIWRAAKDNETMREALESLPKQDLELLRAFHCEGESLETLAAKRRLTVRQVRYAIKKARERAERTLTRSD